MKVINKPVLEQEVRATTNEKNFFSSMKHLFASSFSVLAEMMQNSRRAGASFVAFALDPVAKSLSITDDGVGVSDFQKLLAFCESGWDEQTMLSDTPFGMGFFSVFFACEKVTIRSAGLILTVCLDDIVNKRALLAAADIEPVLKGAVLNLQGVSDDLLAKTVSYGGGSTDPIKCLQMYKVVSELARGFPINVIFNSEVMARPHALAGLLGKTTRLGHIHMSHIHGDRNDGLDSTPDTYGLALYLQGLPIQTHGMLKPKVIVHLDSQVFTPVMPDRKSLYDAEKGMQLLGSEFRAIAVEFLVAMKASMDGKDFVTAYARDCRLNRVLHLLNDINVLPVSNFLWSLDQFTMESSERWGTRDCIDNVVTRADIASGNVKVWRNVPDDFDDDVNAIVLQKMLKRHGVLAFDGVLDAGHWLFAVTPSCHDFKVVVTPIEPKASSTIYIGDYGCTIQLVEAVKVRIASDVDPAFLLEETVVNDWIMVAEEDEETWETRNVICYVTSGSSSSSEAVAVLSNFRDENESYRDEWESAAGKEWRGAVACLCGVSLQNAVNMVIGDLSVNLSKEHAGQMVMLSPVSNWSDHHKSFGDPTITVIDLEDSKLWQRLSRKLAKGKSLKAADLKAAFKNAAGVRERTGGPVKMPKGVKPA
jgi:hypothetical protein